MLIDKKESLIICLTESAYFEFITFMFNNDHEKFIEVLLINIFIYNE